ncbi:MAG: hypothetical protein M3Y40_00090, partial [Chloroflexota bacterium]|nr:hypothetical protein [Chloroflexota bacterium]
GEVHRSMIFTRLVPAAVLVLVGVPLLGPGWPDPAVNRAARTLVLERATAADDALAALETALSPGLDAGRRGAALVVSGTEAPGAELERAGAEIAAAEEAADRARRAVEALEGARLALGEGEAVELDLASGEVGSVAAQLESAAPAANAFARMRTLAESLVARLERVLAALEDGALADARSGLAAVRADHDALAAWEVGLVTLPVWLDTTDAMIGALESILAATESGDNDAARAAAEDFARAVEDAAPADRALRIAIGEGGSAVTAAPLARLADLLRDVSTARLAVASIVQTVGR